MRYQCDRSYERHDLVILGGSPMRILRVAPAALPLLTDLESGCYLQPTSSQQTLLDRLENAGLIHPMPMPASQASQQHNPSSTSDGAEAPLSGTIPVITPVHRNGLHRNGHGDDAALPFTVPGALLVDDGSTPAIPGAQIRLEVNAGPAVARNTGLNFLITNSGEPEYVIFLDADVDPGPDPYWYLPLLALCERDPQLAVVAPRVCSSPGLSRRDRYESTRSPLDLGDQPGRVQPGTRISYLPSTALICRVSALREVGGFSADLRFGEDVDLIWRLIAAGWSCRYHPEVVVHHPPRSSWQGWCRQRIGYGSSAASLALRHKGKVAPARFHPYSWATWAFIVSGQPLLAAVTTAGSAVALARKVPGLPRGVAVRLVLSGTWLSGLGLARALRRVWWPLLVPFALISRRARITLLLSLIATGPPHPTTAINILDDLSYSLGIWKGIFNVILTRDRDERSHGTQRIRRWGALWALFPSTSRPPQGATVRT